MKHRYLFWVALAMPGSPALGQAPTNDDCANATVLLNGPQFVSYDNTNASTGTAVSSCGGQLGVWYEWSPDVSGTYRFETCGLAGLHDNILTLYDGCGGAELACSDDGCQGIAEADLFVSGLSASATYALRIGSFWPTGASGTLEISCASCPPPNNDECVDALAIVPGDNPVANSQPFATPSGIQPSGLPPFVNRNTPDTACEDLGTGTPDAMHVDTWYTFTPPVSVMWRLSTCATGGYNSKIAIYSGDCGNLTPLACNDDGQGCALGTSVLRSNLCGGNEYFVQLGGFSPTQQGTATLEVLPETASVGVRYCGANANSFIASGAQITGTGTRCVSENNLVLFAGPAPSGQPGIFFYGSASTLNPMGFGSFEGRRCVFGDGVRLLPAVVSTGGFFSTPVDNTHPIQGAGITAGQTAFFQCWFRDPAAGDIDGDGMDEGVNYSSALEVRFLP